MRNAPPHPLERWSPWLFALLSLTPLVWCWSSIQELFWFGDDWDLLDQIWRGGFWHWVSYPFAESYAPFWKALWGGLAIAGNGSYLVMILFNWLLHALNVALFGLWLRRNDFGPLALAVSLLGFGLAAANIETLGWSVQVSMILAQTFFFAALWWFDRHGGENGTWRWSALLVLFAFSAGSATSFARGVLTGATLAGVVLLAPFVTGTHRSGARAWRTRALVAGVSLLPALAVTWVIMNRAGGNQHLLFGEDSVLGPSLEFAVSYFCAAPFVSFLDINGWGWRTIALLGVLKVCVLVGGWRAASIPQRRVLLTLLLLELGTAVLLGIGRYHTGTYAVTSSRYQYISLACTMPFAGLYLAALLQRAPLRGAWRPRTAVVVAVAVAWIVAHDWPRAMRDWAGWRGRDGRRIVFVEPHPPAEGAIPGIPMMTTQRAKEIAAHYNLH